MSVGVLEPEKTVADSNKKRDDQTVKLERELVNKARLIIEARELMGDKINLASYLSGILRPIIERDFDKVVAGLQTSQQKRR